MTVAYSVGLPCIIRPQPCVSPHSALWSPACPVVLSPSKVTAAGLDKNALPRWRELEESFEPTVALNVSAGMLQV